MSIPCISQRKLNKMKAVLDAKTDFKQYTPSIPYLKFYISDPLLEMSSNSQSEDAIKLYEGRSSEYDASWHPDFTRRFASYLDLSPGQHVLDLACGTGLLTFLLADAVGPNGRVVGVDVTPGMLAQAKAKKEKDADKYSSVELYEGDILSLEKSIDGIKEESFDVITIASAIVLFPDPRTAIRYWAKFLKPGGVFALDSTHPRNLLFGSVIERVARDLVLPVPYYRQWSESEDVLRGVLEFAGLNVEKVDTIEDQRGQSTRYHLVSDADDVFEKSIGEGNAAVVFADESLRNEAKVLFRQEWAKLAVDGKVQEVDAVFISTLR